MKNTKRFFLLVIVLMAMVIFSFSTYISIRFSRESALSIGKELLLSRADRVSSVLYNQFSELGNNAFLLSKTISYDPSFSTDVYNRMIADAIDANPILFGMGYWMEPYVTDSDTEYYGPYLYNENGELVTTMDYSTKDYDYFSWDWYRKGIETRESFVLIGPYFDETLGTLFVTAASPIITNGDRIGVVTADATLPELTSYLTSVSLEYDVHAYLIAPDGSIIKPDASVLDSFDYVLDHNQPLIYMAMNATESGLYHEVEERIIHVWSPVGYTDLRLLMVLEENRLYGAINANTQRIILYFSVALVLFVFLLNLILIYRMEHPLRRLIDSTYQIKKRKEALTDLQKHHTYSFEDLIEIIGVLLEERTQHIEELQASNFEIQYNYQEVVRTLSNAIEAKDSYTRGHCDNVTSLSLAVGEHLNLNENELGELMMAAQLHDIGKISVPTYILNKPDKLTEEEFDYIRQHPTKGYEIIKDIDYLKNSSLAVLQHHERPDGTGYPQGLSGDGIHLYAKIISVTDAYDAMTRARPYRKEPLSISEALKILRDSKGSQFDPAIVDVFLKIMETNLRYSNERK